MVPTRTISQACCTILILGVLLISNDNVNAQGRLGRARKSVSAKKQRPAQRPAPRPAPARKTKSEQKKEKKPKASPKPAPKPTPKPARAPAPKPAATQRATSHVRSQPKPAAKTVTKTSAPNRPAQGRLAAVSSATRKHDSPRNDRHDSHHHSKHRPHHRGHIAHHARPVPVLHFGSSYCYEPPVIVQDVHVHEYYSQPTFAPAPLTHDLPPVLPVVPPSDGPIYRANNEPIDHAPYYDAPYYDGPQTIDAPPEVASEIAFADDWFSTWNAKLTAIYGSDFDDLSVAGMEALVVAPGSLGIELGANHLLEEGVNYRSHLWLGDANVVFEVLGEGPLRGRVGVGVNWLGDSIGVEAGLNLTAGFDLHLNERWTLAGQADIGSLGDADFSHLRMDIGRRFGNAEWIVGYDRYEIDGVGLGNWTTGLRLRF